MRFTDVMQQLLIPLLNRDGTPLGLEAKAFMAKGDLVPDSVMVGLVAGELKKLDAEPWLLDGFPR